MKKLTTSQWLLGVGIIALAYILYKKQKENVVVEKDDTPNIDNSSTEESTTEETTSGGSTTQEPTLDTSDIPTECLDGFELNGDKYYIKENKFIKE